MAVQVLDIFIVPVLLEMALVLPLMVTHLLEEAPEVWEELVIVAVLEVAVVTGVEIIEVVDGLLTAVVAETLVDTVQPKVKVEVPVEAVNIMDMVTVETVAPVLAILG